MVEVAGWIGRLRHVQPVIAQDCLTLRKNYNTIGLICQLRIAVSPITTAGNETPSGIL